MPETPAKAHIDLLLRVHPWVESREYYPVEAQLDDGSHFAGGELRLDHAALREAGDDAESYGSSLFYTLFSGPIRHAYDKATGQAEAQTEGRMRIRLWIDPHASELHAFAWERLHYPRQDAACPLAIQVERPFSRYISLNLAEPEPVITRPIRLLFAIANPGDLADYGLPPLDVRSEVVNVLAALGNLRRAGHVHVTLLPGAGGLEDDLRAQVEAAGCEVYDGPTSLDTLVWLLSSSQGPNLGYQLFHFVGHGAYDGDAGVAALYLEDDQGFARVVEDADLVTRLQSLPLLPHLIFLASCESAKRSTHRGNPFVGLAPWLVKAGVPAVIAMQDRVPVLAARELTQDFYRALLEHGVVDRALNQARLQLYEKEEPAWAIPALFMRLEAGQLFSTDPVRAALNAMAQSKRYNPLPANEPYLPMDVLHISGRIEAVDLQSLTQAHAPSLTLTDAVFKICDPSKSEYGAYGPTVIALIGGDGMGKTVSLAHIGQVTAQKSLRPYAARVVVPASIDLQALIQKPTITVEAVRELVLDALRPYWPQEHTPQPEDLLREHTAPLLRVIVDGSDDLPDHIRHRAWQALNDFIMENSRHEYIVAFNASQLDTGDLRISDVLLIQPISQRNIRHFLTETLATPAGQALYAALERAQLFDMAAMPWLLFEMLKQTQDGNPPRSRTDVLKSLVEHAIVDIAPDQGMRARAAETLYTLAWAMQTTRRTTLGVDEGFGIMAQVRGNRGYNLETFYQELITHELLEPVGQESMGFTRSHIREYGFAQALLAREDWEAHLDNITATLGRYNRYLWWEDALTLVSGLIDKPEVLIRKILYGVALSEGEQIFLAARCIQEARCRGKEIDEQLVNYVGHALWWRVTHEQETRVARRVRAIEALEQLKLKPIQTHLINFAFKKARRALVDELDDDYGTVQLAAALAVHRMIAAPLEELPDPETRQAQVLHLWAQHEDEALIELLEAEGEISSGAAAVAAFALGDLKTPRATDYLIQTFRAPELRRATYRNLVTALSLLDTATVTQRVILPLLKADPPEASEAWYPYLAYLIGKIRTQDPVARDFLYRCARDMADTRLKALAIQSLGWLYDLRSKTRFEDVALGTFDSLNLPELDCVPPRESQRLQRKALEALRHIGDAESLRRLQSRPAGWSLELEHAFYWTIEEIIARQNER